MFSNIINAVKPFAYALVVLAGASLAGWINFSNQYPVGVVTVGAGILLVIIHVAESAKSKTVKK